MSMNLSVYVGPYLEIPDGDDDLYWDHDDIVTDGRGEAAKDAEPLYLIPNREIPCVTREMSFDRHDEYLVVPIVDRDVDGLLLEMDAFRDMAKPYLDALTESGGTFQLKWGIVCGVF